MVSWRTRRTGGSRLTGISRKQNGGCDLQSTRHLKIDTRTGRLTGTSSLTFNRVCDLPSCRQMISRAVLLLALVFSFALIGVEARAQLFETQAAQAFMSAARTGGRLLSLNPAPLSPPPSRAMPPTMERRSNAI